MVTTTGVNYTTAVTDATASLFKPVPDNAKPTDLAANIVEAVEAVAEDPDVTKALEAASNVADGVKRVWKIVADAARDRCRCC